MTAGVMEIAMVVSVFLVLTGGYNSIVVYDNDIQESYSYSRVLTCQTYVRVSSASIFWKSF